MSLFKNFTIKLFSILCALAFWFFLVTFQNIIYDIQEPLELEILNKPQTLEIPYALPDINVRVTAPKDEVSFLRPEDFRAYIDLKNVDEGDRFVDVQVSTNRNNVNVVSYTPDQVAITLEGLKTKSFAIEGNVVGEPDSEYMVGEPSHTPNEVIVGGPKSLIDRVAYVGYKIILHGNESQSAGGTYKLTAYDKDHRAIEYGLTFRPGSVEVNLNVIKKFKEKSVPVRIVYGEGIDSSRINFSSAVPQVLVIKGPFQELPTVQFIETVAVSVEQVEAAITGEEVFVDLVVPEGFEILSGEEKVQITIR